MLVVATPQVIAHQDARRLIAHLRQRGGRRRSGRRRCRGGEHERPDLPGCGQTTPLFPPAPEQDSIWGLIPRLASIPFSYQAARDADEGRPVMITGAVTEQDTAYKIIADQIAARLDELMTATPAARTGPRGRAGAPNASTRSASAISASRSPHRVEHLDGHRGLVPAPGQPPHPGHESVDEHRTGNHPSTV